MLPTHEGNDDSREDDDATITDEFEQNHATGENFGDLKYGANHVEKISLGKSVEETAKLIVSENVIARLFRNIPILKLEVVNKRSLLLLVVVVLVLNTIALINATFYGVFIQHEFHRSSCSADATTNETLIEAIIYVQLILSTALYLVLLFLFASYPQRILMRLFQQQLYPAPEQLLLTILVVFINLVPGFNIVRLLYIWQYSCLDLVAVELALRRAICSETSTSEITEESLVNISRCGISVGLGPDGSALSIASNIMNILFLATFLLAITSILRFQSSPSDLQERLEAPENLPEGYMDEDPEEDRCEVTRIMREERSLYKKIKDQFETVIDETEQWKCLGMEKLFKACLSLRNGLTISLSAICLVYVVYMITVSILFQFNISIIPLISILTVARVCFVLDQDKGSSAYCSQGTIAFQRALAVLGGFILELILCFFIHKQVTRTRAELKKLPYAENRSKHLGFHTFMILNGFAAIYLLTISLILIFLEPPQYWVFNFVFYASESGPQLVMVESPLYFVGVSTFEQEFLSFYIVFICWLFPLCYVYLPADSLGFRGWFVSASDISIDSWRKRQYFQRQPLLYIVLEKDFADLRLLAWRSKRNQSFDVPAISDPRTNTKEVRDLLNTIVVTDSLAELPMGERELIGSQVKSHVICMETSMLMFGFTLATYYINEKNSDSENQKFIQDQRFELLYHFFEASSDTHVVISKSRDRIVIAFRGTVTTRNVKTDLEYDLALHPLADELKSSFEDLKEVNELAQVHSGFLKAYTSVRTRVHKAVSSLLDGNEEYVIFCCGHSLGGGLATMAAFDLAVQFKPKGINCTTFGCPKIGNVIFKEVYNKVVPNHFRFVLIRDLIPALRKPFSLFVYRHVGVEIALDISGNMVINPNFIERLLLLKFRRYNQSNHFMSRYGLALMTWIARAHSDTWEGSSWLIVNSGIARNCRVYLKRLSKTDKALYANLRRLIISEGVEFLKDKVIFRDIAVQTDPVVFADHPSASSEQKGFERALEVFGAHDEYFKK